MMCVSQPLKDIGLANEHVMLAVDDGRLRASVKEETSASGLQLDA